MPTVDGDLPSGPTPEEFSAQIFGAPGPPGGAGGLELAPFRGVRFAPEVVGDLGTVTTPPYDLIDERAVQELMAGSPHNAVRLILPQDAAAPSPTCSGSGNRYRAAGGTLRRWIAEGALVIDSRPGLYVHEVRDEAGGVLQRGLIGALGLRAETDKAVLPHENVFSGPVRDRLALMTATGANLEPIFTVYEGGDVAARIVDETAEGAAAPVARARTGDGLTHRLWAVTDPARHARVADDLRDRQALIADGHHRYATYRALQARHHAAGDGPGPWDFGLALLVDSTRYPPRLSAIHRVLPGLPPDVAALRAAAAFRVTDAGATLDSALSALAAAGGPAFLLGGGDRLHLLTDPDPGLLESAMPDGHSARWRRLDTAVLDRLLIEQAWGISEDEHTVEIVHHDPVATLDRARRAGGTAVVLNPLKTEDVLAVATAGERVPRKSTSFGPKPRTGLVLRLLDPGP